MKKASTTKIRKEVILFETIQGHIATIRIDRHKLLNDRYNINYKVCVDKLKELSLWDENNNPMLRLPDCRTKPFPGNLILLRK